MEGSIEVFFIIAHFSTLSINLLLKHYGIEKLTVEYNPYHIAEYPMALQPSDWL